MTHGSRGRLSTMSLCSINEHLKCSCHVITIYHTYIYTYIYIYIYIYTYTIIYIYIYTYTYIYIYTYTYTYIYIHIHIYTYTYIYIHIHIYRFHNILQIYPKYIQVSHFLKKNVFPMTSPWHPKLPSRKRTRRSDTKRCCVATRSSLKRACGVFEVMNGFFHGNYCTKSIKIH